MPAVQQPTRFVTKQIAPTGGMVVVEPGVRIPLEASPDMLNCTVFQGTLRKRYGYTKFPSGMSALSSPVMGLYSTQDEAANTHLVANTETQLVKLITGVWTVLTGPALTGGAGAFFQYETSQNSIVFSQGVDQVMRHDIATATTVYAILNASCPAARYLTRFADRLFIAHTVEGGATKPFRIRRSIAGNHADWVGVGSGFTDISESPYHIRGIRKLGAQMAVYTEGSVWLGTRTGSALAPAEFDPKSDGTGLFAERSITSLPDGEHEFLGTDDVYLFNGSQPIPIAQQVRDQIFSEVTTVSLRSMFSQTLLDTKEYLFFIVSGGGTTTGYSNKVWVGNWARGIWYPWAVNGMTCAALYRIDNTKTIDDIDEPIDSQLYEIDSRFISQAFPVLITGDENGFTYQWGPQYSSDDGTAITCHWTSRDFESDDLDPERRPSKITLRGVGIVYRDIGTACTLNFYYSTNGGQSWQGPYPKVLPTTGSGGFEEVTLSRQITGKRVRFKFEQMSATEGFEIASLNPVFELRAAETV